MTEDTWWTGSVLDHLRWSEATAEEELRGGTSSDGFIAGDEGLNRAVVLVLVDPSSSSEEPRNRDW